MSEIRQDLSRGYVPFVLVLTFLIPTAIYIGMYFGRGDAASNNLASQLSSLQAQVSTLTTQVGQISVAVARPPQLPENVAYKADLLRFCITNKNLTCPTF